MRLQLGMTLGSNKVGAVAVVAPTLLSDVLSGLVYEIDVTLADSYAGSGSTIANLTNTPADGSAKAAYNYTKDAGAVFTGSAGSPGAYLALDGASCLSLAANTTMLAKLHRTDSGATPYTFILVGRFVPKIANQNACAFMGTNGLEAATVGYNWTNGTYSSALNTATSYTVGGFQVATTIPSGPVSCDNTDRVLIMTNSGTGIKFYSNSSTPVSATRGFITITADAAYPFQIGSAGNNLAKLYNGGRIKASAMLNRVITDLEAATILSTFGSRHGVSYGS
jgi:hypothetical protein